MSSSTLEAREESRTYSASRAASISTSTALTVLGHGTSTTTAARRCGSRSSRGRRPGGRSSGGHQRRCCAGASARSVRNSSGRLAVSGRADGSRVAGALGVAGSLGDTAGVDGWARVDVGGDGLVDVDEDSGVL